MSDTIQRRPRYSEAFKRHVVAEYEQGATVTELMRRYNIRGHGTIKRWVERYGTKPYRIQTVFIRTPEDLDHVRQLQQRLQALEHLVAELTLENRMLRAALEAAGVDPKKLTASPPSSGPTRPTASPSATPADGSA